MRSLATDAAGIAIGTAIVWPLAGASVALASALVTFALLRIITRISCGRWFV